MSVLGRLVKKYPRSCWWSFSCSCLMCLSTLLLEVMNGTWERHRMDGRSALRVWWPRIPNICLEIGNRKIIFSRFLTHVKTSSFWINMWCIWRICNKFMEISIMKKFCVDFFSKINLPANFGFDLFLFFLNSQDTISDHLF